MYETARKTRRTRAAAVSGRSFARCGPPSGRGGEDARGFAEHGFPMEEDLSTRWARRSESQAASGAQTQVEREPTGEAGTPAAERSWRVRLCDRPVDAEANCRSNREALWRLLRSLRRLARAARHGLELSKAGASGSRAARRGHRFLVSTRLATHKKTLDEAAVTSLFWTRVASCSSRWSVAHGRPEAARRFSTVGIGLIVARRSRPLPSSPGGGGWVW